ncbi:MAG: NAD(+)/NADH kinase [Bacteroidales bacterium]|nr:NAD(+)/NADH kinase [Bacteroidales bacterium]
MKLAVYGSRHQEDYIPAIADFLLCLKDRGDSVVMHAKLYQYLLHAVPAALACVTRVTDTPDFDADFAVSLGGDGTFLRTAAWVGDKEIPVVGVNTGHLGFLASIGVDELAGLPARLADGDYELDRRSLIEVTVPDYKGWPYALNEVTLTKSESSSMIHVHAGIDGVELADYRADGLIVATPTGSTAYNMSVGGPIVQPSAPVFVLSPIAAHSLSMRPLVVADTSRLDLACEGRAPRYRLTVDGRATVLGLDTPVSLAKAPFCVVAVQMRGHNFADTLRNKLQWG